MSVPDEGRSKVTLVTGGSSGIGRAICEQLLAEGRTVVNVDRRECEWGHGRLISRSADLTVLEELQAVATRIKREFMVCALVNNAGANNPGTLESFTLADLEQLSALHLRAPAVLAKEFASDLKQCGVGRIVNVATRAVLGREGRLAYASTKAGLVGMTRVIALELGRYGVTVNAVAPGPVETELLTRSNPNGRSPDEIPVRRLGRPEDVARAVSFFLSPENGFVTGQLLFVCGGTSLGGYGV